MAVDKLSLAQRLAALPVEKRRRVIEQIRGQDFDVSLLPIVPMRDGRALPLSYSQKALWLTWSMAPDSPAYNMAGRLGIERRPESKRTRPGDPGSARTSRNPPRHDSRRRWRRARAPHWQAAESA